MSALPHLSGISRRHLMPFWLRLSLIAVILLGSFQSIPQQETTVFAAGTPCVNSGPGSYVSRVCLTAPADGATLTDTVATTVTITAASGTLPPVDSVRFYLNRTSSGSTSSLAADYASPYTIQVPTERFVDGSYRLEAAVIFDDGYTTPKSTLLVTLSNGVTTAPHTSGSWNPKTSGSSPLHIVAAGDGAGGLPGATAVGKLATDMNPNLFLYLGDVYNSGTYTEFFNYYGPTLGGLYNRTNPVPGNHETGNRFQGYMDYWDMNKHYYSFNSGGWHFIALDSTTEFGQTAVGTSQYNWLSQDLANSNSACTLVYFHHPRYGLTSTSGTAYMQDIWSLLAENDVDVVLAGHEHNYQRWMPMNAAGQPVADGITQYVVGTGGHELMGFHHSDSRVPARLRADGVLSLTLGAGGGSSRFVTTSGSTFDEASFDCHGDGTTPTPTPSPSPSPSPTVTPSPTTPLQILPVADARVAEAEPDTNFGTSTSLRADQSPNESSYLRFNVQGLTTAATRATLRLYVRDGTGNAPSVSRSTDTTWSETTITWNNKPATGSVISDQGAVSTGTWMEYDVTSQITGNGLVTFVLTAQSTDALSVGSRESSTFEPRLIIQRSGGTTTPTPTSTPSPTVTPTPSPTPSPTPAQTGTLTFEPEADTMVQQAVPTTNFGTANNLRSDQSPQEMSFLRFNVLGVKDSNPKATLRLYVRDGTTNAPTVALSSDITWSETGMTWDNKPATGTVVSDLGAVSIGTWIEYDVSQAITKDGRVTLALVSQSSDALSVNSSEASSNRPQLIIVDSGGGGLKVTPTATPSPSPTPTATPSPSPMPTEAPSATPSLRLSVDEGPVGSYPVVYGTNFAPGEQVRFTWNSADGPELRMITATASGAFSRGVTIPDVPTGTYTIVATGQTSGAEESIPFTVTGPTTPTASLALSADEGPAGSYPTVYGADFASDENVRLSWQTANGTVLRTITATASGAFSRGVTIPSVPAGAYTIVATGLSSGIEESVPFTVTASAAPTVNSPADSTARLRLSVNEGSAGTYPTVYGVDFTSNENVRLSWNSATGTELRTVIATGSGAFSRGVTIPDVPTGAYTIVATGLTSGTEASAEFTVTSTRTRLATAADSGTPESTPVTRAQGPTDTITQIPESVQPTATSGTEAATETGGPPTPSLTETTVPEPTPSATTAPEPTPTATSTIEPTPLPIVNGWQEDPNVPWWFVTDEDPTTTWSGNVVDENQPIELGFDLGTLSPVSHLRWNSTWPMQGDMEIRLSNDGTNWYRLTTIHLDQQTPDLWADIPVHTEVRYINLVFTHPDGTGNVGTITGFEIWEEPSGSAQRIDQLTLIVPTPVPTPTTEVPIPTEPEVTPTIAPPEPTVIPTVVPAEPTVAPTEESVEPTETIEPEPVEPQPTESPPDESTEEVVPDGE